jgi:hypothetical protein
MKVGSRLKGLISTPKSVRTERNIAELPKGCQSEAPQKCLHDGSILAMSFMMLFMDILVMVVVTAMMMVYTARKQ